MENYLYLVPVAAVLALLFAAYLAAKVSKQEPPTDTKKEIAAAIAEGARAILKAENKKFQYLNNCWSTMSGLHQSLISVFSEYILRNEKDIQDLITLINDVPRYTNDVLEYTKNLCTHETARI